MNGMDGAFRSDTQVCTICDGLGGTFSADGAHFLCEARRDRGVSTPKIEPEQAPDAGGPWFAWETFSGYTVATCEGFNSRGLPVLKYDPPLSKRSAQLLARGLNHREQWALDELEEHRTRRWVA